MSINIEWMIYYRSPRMPKATRSYAYGIEWGWSLLYNARGLRLHFHRWTWTGFWRYSADVVPDSE